MCVYVCVCVYLSSGFKGQCFNYAIPIPNFPPRWHPFHTLGLQYHPSGPPGVFGEKGFQLVPVSLLGLHGSGLKAVPQPRNLSRQVFIAALVEKAVLTYAGWGYAGRLGDQRLPSSSLCKNAVAKRESSSYLVWRNEKAPLHAHESTHTNSLWAFVWRMDRHRSKRNEHQSGVCTKSARRRFRTQYLCFVER